MRQRRIQYGIDLETGLSLSRYEDKAAIPVLQWDKMKPKNNFQTQYELESFPVSDLYGLAIRWTRKIPTAEKNIHRKFWGMKPLKE